MYINTFILFKINDINDIIVVINDNIVHDNVNAEYAL
jgi:hypothetical protein